MNAKLRQTLKTLQAGAAVAGALTLTASGAAAQWGRVGGGYGNNMRGELLFEWRGRVDRETQIEIGRNGVEARGVQGDESRGRFTNRGSLPRGGGTLYIERIDGRGDIDVLRQPSSSSNARNDRNDRNNGRWDDRNGRGNDRNGRGNDRYSYDRDGVIRIRDPRGGSDTYAIRVYWRPGGSSSSNGDRWGRDGRRY